MAAGPPGGMLLVTVDRLPAWLLPLAGCTWVATPALDTLAGRGLSLDGLFACSDEPRQTLAELLGGGNWKPAGRWPLLDAAAAAGWSPTLVTDEPSLAAACGGEVAVEVVPPGRPAVVAAAAEETMLGRLFAAAAARVAAGGHRLVWCHAASLGVAWDAPESFRTAYVDPDDPSPPAGAALPDLVVDAQTDPDIVMSLRQLFAGQVTLLDACLGNLLAAVESLAARQPWTIVVVGLRGMPLGLHGRVGCGPLLPYAELIQLPAVLVDHAGRAAAQRHGGLTIPADLGRTLLDLATGGDAGPACDEGGQDSRAGRSLTGLLDSWRGPRRDRVICRASQGVAVITPAWQLVCPPADDDGPRPHLYARPDDYFNACDVADRSGEVAEELAALAAVAATAEAWTKPLSKAALTPAGQA